MLLLLLHDYDCLMTIATTTMTVSTTTTFPSLTTTTKTFWNFHFIDFWMSFYFWLILRINLRIQEQFYSWLDNLKCILLTDLFANLQKIKLSLLLLDLGIIFQLCVWCQFPLFICLESMIKFILVLAPFLRQSHTHGWALRNGRVAGKD